MVEQRFVVLSIPGEQSYNIQRADISMFKTMKFVLHFLWLNKLIHKAGPSLTIFWGAQDSTHIHHIYLLGAVSKLLL